MFKHMRLKRFNPCEGNPMRLQLVYVRLDTLPSDLPSNADWVTLLHHFTIASRLVS